jgi:hypothetical protein
MAKIRTALNLIKCIQSFEPIYNHGDQNWSFYFKINGKWQRFQAQKYQNTIYIFSPLFDNLEIQETGEIKRAIGPREIELLSECVEQISRIYKLAQKDPLEYHRTLQRGLPPSLRQGVISRKFIKQLIPEFMPFHQEFSPAEMKQILTFLMAPSAETKIEVMTAGIYFGYCRITYLANPDRFKEELNENMSGRDMYRRWADGRDGGISKLPLDDANAFQEWYEDKGRIGDHPWEIYRGGNSTHIDLAVVKEHGAWKIKIIAFSSTRLVETCRIALALKKAGMPFELEHAESYLSRLLAEDYVGVLPESESIKYGWHHFPKEFQVADCIHYSWFKNESGRSLVPMAKIKSLVTWLPIRPLFVKTSGDMELSQI